MSTTIRFILGTLIVIFVSCKADQDSSNVDESEKKVKTSAGYEKIVGKTMGTTYHITLGRIVPGIQKKIDQLLFDINNEVSTYIPEAAISRFNKAERRIVLQETKNPINMNRHFKAVFNRAKTIFTETDGAFDPTVMPLVNFWGFGPNKKNPKKVDTEEVKAMAAIVDFDKVRTRLVGKDQKLYLEKPEKAIQLDFSAIAKGYALDKIAFMLEQNAIGNYMIEIGGEVRARGVNKKGALWKIGINRPQIGSPGDDFFKILHLENISIATSGNYRNYFKLNNKIFSHTINPKTGFPERSDLLSCTIFADKCIVADAFATACMVMGLEKAMEKVVSINGIEAYFIYSKDDGTLGEKFTDGAEKFLTEKKSI